jgi:hypothetical protein
LEDEKNALIRPVQKVEAGSSPGYTTAWRDQSKSAARK